jgi:hypothetical protein
MGCLEILKHAREDYHVRLSLLDTVFHRRKELEGLIFEDLLTAVDESWLLDNVPLQVF